MNQEIESVDKITIELTATELKDTWHSVVTKVCEHRKLVEKLEKRCQKAHRYRTEWLLGYETRRHKELFELMLKFDDIVHGIKESSQ